MKDLTFAIGDIHGRADLLEIMLTAIASVALEEKARHRIVFLGDLIDRGPSSYDAVELVKHTVSSVPGSVLILGNHDWFPIRILDELEGDHREMALDHWVWKLGGDTTLRSYGFDPDLFSVEDLQSRFPADHLDLFRNAAAYVELEKHILVHAGLMPGVPLPSQSRRDLMWMREPFLSSGYEFEKTVVHGHTPTESGRCELASRRIGIDTGAYDTGTLSAIQISSSGDARFLAASTATVDYVKPVRLREAETVI